MHDNRNLFGALRDAFPADLVLPHVILLPDASPPMLPAGLGLSWCEVFYQT
jgi:hypothetical protein